jgi:hypothetical protein
MQLTVTLDCGARLQDLIIHLDCVWTMYEGQCWPSDCHARYVHSHRVTVDSPVDLVQQPTARLFVVHKHGPRLYHNLFWDCLLGARCQPVRVLAE